jgi:hypothetical protein
MKAPHSDRNSFTLLGLLVAFFMSAVVIPAIGATPELNPDNKTHFAAGVDSHASQGLPLPLSEEKEEEESRTDKHNTFILTLFSIVFEKQAISPAEPTTWAFNHTNASALTEFPLYLSKQSLLI